MDPMTAREIWNQLPEQTRKVITEIALKEEIQKKCTLDSCPIPEPVELEVETAETLNHLETYLQNISKALKKQNKILNSQTEALQNIAGRLR